MYAFNANLYCDACGESIIASIDTTETPSIDLDDSEQFPQYADSDSGSDCPSHCGAGAECLEYDTLDDGRKIGVLLGHALTPEGIQYVREHTLDLLSPCERFWLDEFGDQL